MRVGGGSLFVFFPAIPYHHQERDQPYAYDKCKAEERAGQKPHTVLPAELSLDTKELRCDGRRRSKAGTHTSGGAAMGTVLVVEQDELMCQAVAGMLQDEPAV